LQVQVRLFTVLREIAGKKEEILEFPENREVTINAVLKALATQHGKAFTDYVYNPQTSEVRGFLQFFINGNSASAMKGLDTELKDGDVLAIVPPVGGG